MLTMHEACRLGWAVVAVRMRRARPSLLGGRRRNSGDVHWVFFVPLAAMSGKEYRSHLDDDVSVSASFRGPDKEAGVAAGCTGAAAARRRCPGYQPHHRAMAQTLPTVPSSPEDQTTSPRSNSSTVKRDKGGNCGGYPRRGIKLAFSWCCLSARRSIYHLFSYGHDCFSFYRGPSIVQSWAESEEQRAERTAEHGEEGFHGFSTEGRAPRGYVTVHVAKSASPCREYHDVALEGIQKDGGCSTKRWSDF